MTGLRKSIATLPLNTTIQSVPENGEPDEDSFSASSTSSTGTLRPADNIEDSNLPSLAWAAYFERELHLKTSDDDEDGLIAEYHVYVTPPIDVKKDPLFICHHGAGASGLSFALLAKEIRTRLPGAGILAVEARGHGSNVRAAEATAAAGMDMSIDTLATDLLRMIKLTEAKLQWPALPAIVLVGHSVGGAVVSTLARRGSLGQQLLAFALIDIVEGSALSALSDMQKLLSTRPITFGSVQDAIDWHVRSRTIRNPDSARVSVPALLKATTTGSWTWRTDLMQAQPFWVGWFTGLNGNFLNAQAAKLLILAGTDRLDRDLTIGQMQGKFQLTVVPEAGHFVHEDVPEKTADILVDFYRRNDRSLLVLPPKVSDLLKQGKKV